MKKYKRSEELLLLWPLLSEAQREELFCLCCFFNWRKGRPVPEWISASQILLGAWLHYTFVLERAWADLMADPDIQLSICGVLTAVFLVMIIFRSLGAR